MKSITSLDLTRDIDNLLNEISMTGLPIEVNWKGKRFKIIPTATTESTKKKSRLDNLIRRPDVIIGDSEDLINISWEHEIKLDLP